MEWTATPRQTFAATTGSCGPLITDPAASGKAPVVRKIRFWRKPADLR